MGIFSIFTKKKAENNYKGYNFSDEEREFGAEIRAKNKEIKLLKLEREKELEILKYEKDRLRLKAEINELKDELQPEYEEDEPMQDNQTDNTFNNLLGTVAMAMMQKNQPQHTNNLQSSNPPQTNSKNNDDGKLSLNDEQLKDIISEIPKKYLILAKTMPDDTIKQYIRGKYPELDEETINRGIKIVKS
jgi:hypothetical protein